jgi:hypothetical protein
VVAQGAQVPADALQSSAINGEMLGPMPTEPIGNPGPVNQSAAALYGVETPGLRQIGRGWLEVGRWWGLRGRWNIPMSDVQTVSLERVMLRRRRDEL